MMRAWWLSVSAMLCWGLSTSTLSASTEVSDFAWVSPAEARVYRLLHESQRVLVRVVDPTSEVVLAAGESLMVPLRGGERVRVAGVPIAVGFGSGHDAVPDVVSWQAEAHENPIELRLPTFSSARFVVVRGLSAQPTPVKVWLAAALEDPLAWHRADTAVATWLEGSRAEPPSLPAAVEAARPTLRFLNAAKQQLSTPELSEASVRWLKARWLELSFQHRPLFRPYFRPATLVSRGGRPVSDLKSLPAVNPELDYRVLRAGEQLTASGRDVDVVTLLISGRAHGATSVSVYSGAVLVRRLSLRTPDRESPGGWLGARQVRVAPPAVGTVRVRVTQGEALVGLRAYRQETTLFDGQQRRQRRSLLRVAPSVTAQPGLAHALLASDAWRTAKTHAALAAQLQKLPQPSTAGKALFLHELLVHAPDTASAATQLGALWTATLDLKPEVALPLRRSALATLDAVSTRVFDERVRELEQPALDQALPPTTALGEEQALIATLQAILFPLRDALGPSQSARSDAWAASSQRSDVIELAQRAWSREAPFRSLEPVASESVDRLTPVAADVAQTHCSTVGPGGTRWVLAAKLQELQVKSMGTSHTRLQLKAAPGAPDQDALITLGGRAFAVHAGARLESTLAVAPGVHAFRQVQGQPLLLRFATDQTFPCNQLFDQERWVALDGQASFELPAGHGLTAVGLLVHPQSLVTPAEVFVRMNGKTLQATYRRRASGVAEFLVEPSARYVIVESKRRLLVRLRVRQRRRGWPTQAPPRAQPTETVPDTETLLAQVRTATRRLREVDAATLQEQLRLTRLRALEALGYQRFAAADRDRLLRPQRAAESKPGGRQPFAALSLSPGAQPIEPLGDLPRLPPLPQPAPTAWFTSLLDELEQGAAWDTLLAVLEKRAAASSSVDALLLARASERAGNWATAQAAWERIARTHTAPVAIARAAELATDRAAASMDHDLTLRAYQLALDASQAGADVTPLLARMNRSLRWLSIGAEQVSNSVLLEHRRGPATDEPLGRRVRRALTDAPDDAVLLRDSRVEFNASRFGSRRVRIQAVCHALQGLENCAVAVRVDGQQLPCIPDSRDAKRSLERRRFGPAVARPLDCQLELPETAGRLSVQLRPPTGAAIGWAVARAVTPDGLEPSSYFSRWLEAEAARPISTWIMGPAIVRVTARSDREAQTTLQVRLQPTGPGPAIERELQLRQELDPLSRRRQADVSVTQPARTQVIIADPGRYRLTVLPTGQRALVKLEVADVIAPPRARADQEQLAKRQPNPVSWDDPPELRLKPIGWDPEPGPLTLGASMALQSADLLEGDRDPTGRYAQLDLHVRRSLSDDLLWAALGVFGRARNGPSSRGAHAGFWLTARDGAPGAFARAELATQKLGREHAVGYFAVAGAFYPQTLGPTLQLVPLAQVVLRRADERGRGQPDADRTVYSPYAASRPHTVDLSLRLDHRPYVDTFLRTGVRARFSPGLVGTDRIDGFASAQLLAGTGLAPWLRFDALLSHRPESPQREHPFTRVAATPTVVFWHWLSDAQRIALEASASWFVDTPGKYGRESALSGQLQLAYDYSYLRGLEDYSLAERPFRARLEEGLPSRRRRTPITRSQWSHDHELP